MSTNNEKTHDITKTANVDAWFTKEIQAIPAATRELLEGYSKVPSDQVLSHVQEQVRFSHPITLSGSVTLHEPANIGCRKISREIKPFESSPIPASDSFGS